MDSFEKAARKMSAGLVEETNPTSKLYSAAVGKPVDFSQPDPLSGNPEIPGAQAQIDAAKAERTAARDFASAASARSDEFMYGKGGNSGYNTQPGSFFARYGTFGRDRAQDILDAEKQGLLTISPSFRADIQKMMRLESKAGSAQADMAEKVYSGAATVIRDGEEMPYRIVDGRHVYK